jgi:hypothetical protein
MLKKNHGTDDTVMTQWGYTHIHVHVHVGHEVTEDTREDQGGGGRATTVGRRGLRIGHRALGGGNDE